MALQMGIAVAQGGVALGKYQTEQGSVLFCALEDSPRRIQDRLRMLLPEGAPAPEHLHFVYDLPRLDRGGLVQISEWVGAHNDCRLVVIDTWGRVRPPRGAGTDLYQFDIDQAGPLQRLETRPRTP
jgi:hypothetical protein